MKIRHKEHGEVEGVNAFYDRRSQIGWVKEGAVRFIADGWEAVPETRLVDVTGEVEIGPGPQDRCSYLHRKNGSGGFDGVGIIFADFTPKIVDRYDLPDDFISKWNNYFIHQIVYREEFMQWLKQFKKPCLIIEKEEPAT